MEKELEYIIKDIAAQTTDSKLAEFQAELAYERHKKDEAQKEFAEMIGAWSDEDVLLGLRIAEFATLPTYFDTVAVYKAEIAKRNI